MQKEKALEARKKIFKKSLTGDYLEIAIKYLNTFPMPNDIGITYNNSYYVKEYKIRNMFFFFGKKIYLVFREDTVDCVSGSGVNAIRTSSTYHAHVTPFDNLEDANEFSRLSNILYNREK